MTFGEHPILFFLIAAGGSLVALVAALVGLWIYWKRTKEHPPELIPIPTESIIQSPSEDSDDLSSDPSDIPPLDDLEDLEDLA